MKFNNLKVCNFDQTIHAYVCYIFKVEKDNGGTITRVHYYRFIDDNDVHSWEQRNWDVKSFCIKLIKNQYVAFCGKIKNINGEDTLTEIAKVLPEISKGKYCLTTMSDDDETNNLVTLEEFYR